MQIKRLIIKGENGLNWANNWKEEGFIEEKLERFFGSSHCLMDHTNAVVKHIQKKSSDHCMLLLDTNQEGEKKKRRFSFYKRWLSKPSIEELVKKSWAEECYGSPMYQVTYKIKDAAWT